MDNISISKIEQEATTLGDDDLVLVSTKTDEDNFETAKMKGSVLKAEVATPSSTIQQACEEAILAQTETIQAANEAAIEASEETIQTACESAINNTYRYFDFENTLILNVPVSSDIQVSKDGLLVGTVDTTSTPNLKINNFTFKISTLSVCHSDAGYTVRIPLKSGDKLNSANQTNIIGLYYIPYL